MSPIQFLARLSALIPLPRHPLVRFHGVFAPHSAWRRHVVALAHSNTSANQEANVCRSMAVRDPDPKSDVLQAPARPFERGGPAAGGAQGQAAIFPPAEVTAAPDTRIDWATLLKRVHDIDALACPCGGRLRVIALITEPEVVVAILTSLHLPSVAPPVARARSPDDYDPVPE